MRERRSKPPRAVGYRGPAIGGGIERTCLLVREARRRRRLPGAMRERRIKRKVRASAATSWCNCGAWCKIGAPRSAARDRPEAVGEGSPQVVFGLAIGGSGNEYDPWSFVHPLRAVSAVPAYRVGGRRRLRAGRNAGP